MQITANPTSFTPNNSLLEITKNVDEPKLPDTSTANPPSAIVTFTGPSKPSDTYEPPRLVNVVQIRSAQAKGVASVAVNQSLISELSSLSTSRSPFSTSSFFNQIGALSRETNQYRNDARSQQMASTKATDKLKLDFEAYEGKPKSTVTLRIRTKDGDNIDVKIQHSSGLLGDSLEFSFNVEGKLSKDEQDALEKLARKLGDIADDFFRTGTTQLHGLKEFDQAQLKDFKIEFSKAKTIDTYTTASYEYSVDEAKQTQTLRAKDGDGYSFDITADLQSLLGEANSSFHQALESYLEVIRKTLNEHQPLQQEHFNSASLRFVIDGLTSLLAPKTAADKTPADSPAEKAIAAFDTGLPDFTAVISAPLLMLYKPEHQLIIPESMTLRLEQRTETALNDKGGLLIKQVNSFERQSREIEGVVGTDNGDLTRGNFTYKTIHEKQEMSRILDVMESGMKSMIEDFNSSMDTKIETYANFYLVDVKTDPKQERKLTQLVNDIQNHNQLQQELNTLKALSETKQNLFH
ncbi:hypothetical protein GCM10011613_09340 [Cellvibrio zantedeschiae]|uniref:Flagellar hook-associated protein 2 C-terminal domain-containing protein n=1 Tax=Cellvibrio zantedeschiae TaxID=1237077 RepID=A0ABQ3AUW1_9GAMM|nr:hypothetical protein [Cellvibrio zantedeschiae]GGY67358.1 hypothetical protein GCM10011613_09340 [Cellvibrio zantedeschiae]